MSQKTAYPKPMKAITFSLLSGVFISIWAFIDLLTTTLGLTHDGQNRYYAAKFLKDMPQFFWFITGIYISIQVLQIVGGILIFWGAFTLFKVPDKSRLSGGIIVIGACFATLTSFFYLVSPLIILVLAMDILGLVGGIMALRWKPQSN